MGYCPGSLDEVIFGRKYPFWQKWLEHASPEDAYWRCGDFRDTLAGITAPNYMIGGWYDFFLPHLIRDYRTLVQAGRKPYLSIGPWTHFDTKFAVLIMQEGLVWLRTHLLDDKKGLREAPVRIFVIGAGDWRK